MVHTEDGLSIMRMMVSRGHMASKLRLREKPGRGMEFRSGGRPAL